MASGRRCITFACVVSASFLAGYWVRQPGTLASVRASQEAVYYSCPMHPHYKSDRPGDAPCCGMRLEPVYAGSQPNYPSALPPGTVEIARAQQQLIGVRLGNVESGPASDLLRVPGRVAVDESRLYRIVTATDGWIRKLGSNPPGTYVRQDEVLATYYTRDLLSSQQNLLYALNTGTRAQPVQLSLAAQSAVGGLNLQIAIDSLRSLGMSDSQIEEIARTAASASSVKLHSPADGFVTARDVSPGQRFEKGAELFRIADLRHVWVLADIFEKDWEFVRPGTVATVRSRGRKFRARMSDALPQLDPQSRTLKARFELDNPEFILRPDTFVDVEVNVTMPETVTVPAEAVLDSGFRKAVYVERGEGIFEPRIVQIGWRLGDRVQITDGLTLGERIVLSGNFLLDSESRMRLASAETSMAIASAVAEKDPVCGMNVDTTGKNVIKTEHGGKTWYFCSQHCRTSFEAVPENYGAAKKEVRANR